MKKLLLSAFVAFAMLASTKTFAQQGFGTNTPSKSAAVDIVSSQRGLLIPRLDLVATDDASPIASTPAQSLLVYNNATAGSGTTAVTPGFYYWDTNKWIRIVSAATEKNTTVVGGNNVVVNSALLPDGVTTQYTVNVDGGTSNGQVLVSVPNPDPATVATEPFISQWVNPSTFINGVNGVTVTQVTNPTTGIVTNEISLGGPLTKPTTITTTAANTLAIDGLTVLDSSTFDPATQNIVVMGADGILKEVAPKVLIEDAIAADNLTAKTLTSAGGIITLNGTAAAANAVLKDVELGIANKSIGAEKLDPGTATPGQIATVIETTPGDATTKVVQYQDPSTAIGKTLTTDNIIGVGADAATATASSLTGAVLTPTYLKIKDNSITALQIGTGAVGTDELAADAVTNAKLADNAVQTENILDGAILTADLANDAVTEEKILNGAVSPEKLSADPADAGKVGVVQPDGTIVYENIDSSNINGQDLTAGDTSIVVTDGTGATLIDTNIKVADGGISTIKLAADAVTNEKLADNAVQTENILDGTIANADLAAQSVTADKMQSKNTAAGTNALLGTVPVADGVGGVTYQTVASAVGENLTTDGKIVIGSTNATTLADAVLVPTELKIAANSITSVDIKDGTIQATDLKAPGTTTDSNTGGTANQMLVTDSSGAVSWQNQSAVVLAGDVTGTTGANEISKLQGVNVATKDANAPIDGEVLTYDDATKTWTPKTVAEASGKGLTTDSVIEITGTGAATIASAPQSVLKDINLSIGTDKITATHIAENAVGASELADNSVASANIINGTIKAEDILAPGSTTDNNLNGTANQVMVTNASGGVSWINQTDLPSNTKIDDGVNTTVAGNGSTASPFTIEVNTANDTTTGAVKQATAGTEEVTIGADGTLSVNEANVTVGTVAGSDVTGQLNDLTVAGIQGTAVSATAPTATNNMLVFQNGQWEPSTVAAAAGKTLTGAGITVTAGTTAGTGTSLTQSVLADVTLGIADNAITSLKIADGAVSNVDLAPLAISPDKMTTYTTANGTATPAVPGTVATAGPNGTVSYQTPNSLVTVDNGISKATDGDIILGGTLNETTTTIVTGGASNTLAVQGLIVPATDATQVMYSEGTTGVLRKAVRSISQYVEASQIVNAISGYNDFVQEINITAKIVSGDINITLPTATATNKGQVVNVKIVNTAEVADYVNILVGSTTLTYGALPYQSWIIKSDGSTWEIVGRN